MPELPEVQTIVNDLNSKLENWSIVSFWTDWPRYFRLSSGVAKAGRYLKNRKILKIERRGKNILFYLSGNGLMVVHLKMTGHFLFSLPPRKNFVHLILDLKRSDLLGRSDLDKKKLYFSDVRKFARWLIGPSEVILARPEIAGLGPDALDISKADFLAIMKRRRGRIKTALLNQTILSGVGNIYSDEALYLAKVHPLSRLEKVPPRLKAKVFRSLKFVLRKALRLRGTTRRDYRDTSGQEGDYFRQRLVYARKGEKCQCGGIISTVKISGRTSYFCPHCQKLYC